MCSIVLVGLQTLHPPRDFNQLQILRPNELLWAWADASGPLVLDRTSDESLSSLEDVASEFPLLGSVSLSDNDVVFTSEISLENSSEDSLFSSGDCGLDSLSFSSVDLQDRAAPLRTSWHLLVRTLILSCEGSQSFPLNAPFNDSLIFCLEHVSLEGYDVSIFDGLVFLLQGLCLFLKRSSYYLRWVIWFSFFYLNYHLKHCWRLKHIFFTLFQAA